MPTLRKERKAKLPFLYRRDQVRRNHLLTT